MGGLAPWATLETLVSGRVAGAPRASADARNDHRQLTWQMVAEGP
jgi:hypothetical protein